MPKERSNSGTESKCIGGRSYNRHQIEHEKSAKKPDIYCYRCGTRMGCAVCCEMPRELICLICHNWATKTGLAFHGNIIPNRKVPRVRTDQGWRTIEGIEPPSIEEIVELAKPPHVMPVAAKRPEVLPYFDEYEEKARYSEREKKKGELADQARILQQDDKLE